MKHLLIACLLIILHLGLSGCNSPKLAWHRRTPQVNEWRLWGQNLSPREVWLEQSERGPVLCINYYDHFGTGSESALWQNWRYLLVDGQILAHQQPARSPIPTNPIGQYARDYPRKSDPNQPNLPTPHSDFFARQTESGVDIVDRNTQHVASQIPGTEVYEQDGKANLLVVQSRVDHGPEFPRGQISGKGLRTFFLLNGKIVTSTQDRRSSAAVLRASPEPLVVCEDSTWPETSHAWFGPTKPESRIHGRAIVVYENWLVTYDYRTARIYTYDLSTTRPTSKNSPANPN